MRPFVANSRALFKAFPWLAMLLALTAAGASGCASFRTEWGKPIAAERSSFTEGRTPVAMVLQVLGPPAKAAALPDGYVFLYEHAVLNEFQFGLSVNYGLLRYLKFIRARDRIERDELLLTFDQQGVLRGVGRFHSKEKLSGGYAGQLIFSAVSLTDPALRELQSAQLWWGRSCLEPLPVTLNSGQSLQSGEHGLQLNLAPKYAGQESLEMARPIKASKAR